MTYAMVHDCGSFILDLRKAWHADAMAFLVSTSINCLIVATGSMVANVDFVVCCLLHPPVHYGQSSIHGGKDVFMSFILVADAAAKFDE